MSKEKSININIGSLIESLELHGNDYEMPEAKHKIEEALINILEGAVGSYKKRRHVSFHVKDLDSVKELIKETARLKYHETTTVGLWAIDRDPRDVSRKWIVKNAFRITSPGNAPECID